LGIPVVKDRIVQTALKMVIEPIFEQEFEQSSYGFRPHRGCKDALREVDGLIKEGFTHVVDADLKSYFDTIPHERLMALVQERISDGREHPQFLDENWIKRRNLSSKNHNLLKLI
jgi:RNA-directed DNA polymerase